MVSAYIIHKKNGYKITINQHYAIDKSINEHMKNDKKYYLSNFSSSGAGGAGGAGGNFSFTGSAFTISSNSTYSCSSIPCNACTH